MFHSTLKAQVGPFLFLETDTRILRQRNTRDFIRGCFVGIYEAINVVESGL